MRGGGLNILIVEDNPGDVRLVKEMLLDEGDWRLVGVDRLSQGIELLERNNIDVTLLDLGLPDSQGLDTLTRARKAAPHTPIIVLTGLADEEFAIEAVKSQAQDYLIKGEIDSRILRHSIRYAIEREQIEDCLKRSEKRYRMLFDTSTDGLVQISSDGTIIDVNEKILKISGFSREELLGRKLNALADMFTRESLSLIMSNFSKRMLGKKVPPFEVEALNREGKSVFIEMDSVVLRDADGEESSELVVLHDISRRKRSESELRDAELRYRTLVEKTPAITYIASLAEPGKILYVSPQIKAYGITPKKFIQNPENWYKRINPTDRATVLAELQRSRANKESYTLEYKIVTEQGRLAWLRDEAIPVQNEQGRKLIMQGVIVDITERKAAEEKIAIQSRELEISNRELKALYDVSTAISGNIDLDHLLTRTIDMITSLHLFEFEERAGIFIVEGDRLRLAAHTGHDDAFIELHKGFRVGQRLCGRAAQSGEIMVSRNCHDDERHTIKYDGMDDHGHIIVPLKAHDSVEGVLYLYVTPGLTISRRKLDLLKSIGSQLGVAIENARLYEEARTLSLHDPLTGLANRNMMNVELSKAFARSRRSGNPISLVMLDLDYFKAYNDSFGHRAGDRLLEDVATVIRETIREVDLAVRYGGEEFLIILPDTGTQAALEVAERLREYVDNTAFCYSEEQPTEHITVSLGVATLESVDQDEDELIGMADDALYQAKRQGRNRVIVWNHS